MNRFSKSLALQPISRRSMSDSLRTMVLATGCILAVGTSAARAQMPLVYYYPAPGNYATTQGTVSIPAAGYYYNVPLYGVAGPASPAPAQGFTYSNSSFYYYNPGGYYYYPHGGASTGGGVGANIRRSANEARVRVSAIVSGDEQDNPNW
jgi:hypothetical protein